MADAIEAAEALDVEVQQLAGPVPFVAHRSGRRIQLFEPPQPSGPADS